MEASEIAEASVTTVQREVAALALGTPQLQPRKLRSYQIDCVDTVFRAFANGRRAPLIVLSTGGGKTIISAEIIRRLRDENPGFNYRIWFLAHRKKLLDQAYRTIKLVAPEVTAGIVQGNRRDIGKFLTLGSIDTLANRARFDETCTGRGEHCVQARAPSLVIIDECFPAGTKVDGRPIETICVGDCVRSYDESVGRIVERRVANTMRRPAPSRVVVVNVGDHRFVCTEEHPVLTRRGWVAARELVADDEVLLHENVCQVSDDHTEQQEDLSGLSNRVAGGEPAEVSVARELCDVRSSSRAVLREGERGAEQRACVLFEDVWPRSHIEERVHHNGQDQSQVRLGAHDTAQPDAFRRSPSEDERNASTHRPRADGSRWQRTRTDGRGVASVRPYGTRMVHAVDREDRSLAAGGGTAPLQDRRGACVGEDCDRDRRQLTHVLGETGPGPTQGRVLTWRRLDRVQVHERTDPGGPGDLCPDGFVYNLEIEGTHTYLVDDVVVHNCHHSTSAKYLKLLGWLREMNPELRILGMTATPGRTDGTALDKVFDGVAYERNTFQLINDGALVPPRGVRIDLKVNLDVIPTDSGEFKRAPLSKVMSQPDVMKAVVDGYLQYGEGKKLLGFCVTVKHAHDLAECFRQNGIPSRAVDGGMKEDEQDALLAAFSEGKIRVLLSCDLLTEGYDDPSAQGVLMARPTNSQLVYIQAIGRALRPAPAKVDALVLDCVGNSQRHQLAQLASLAGLVPLDEGRGTARAPGENPELGDATVRGFTGHAIDFRVLRQRVSKWSWVETRFGWTVSIPRIGYFLLAWCANDRSLVDVKFHDMREGHRDKAPHVLSTRLDFEMAYGLVEQEIERLFTARTSRVRFKERDATDAGPEVDTTRQVIEQGMSGELFSPEDLMRSDANWRDKSTSDRQRNALVEIGVKPDSVPKTAGEASDLFSVMTIERNAKMREPATPKQRAFLVGHKLASSEEIDAMTKKQAQALIVRRLKELESRKRVDERFDDGAPPPEDDDSVE